jgi:hypothetical protein
MEITNTGRLARGGLSRIPAKTFLVGNNERQVERYMLRNGMRNVQSGKPLQCGLGRERSSSALTAVTM